jgi:hypothetical protein
LILLTIVVFILRAFLLKKALKNYVALAPISTEKQFLLTENYIQITNGNNKYEIDYNSIYDLEVNEDYCYLFTTPNSPYIIPKSTVGFPDFFDTITKQLKQN